MSTGMLRLDAELHRNILDIFNEYGVQIMTPAYEGDPEPQVVPPRGMVHCTGAARRRSGRRGERRGTAALARP